MSEPKDSWDKLEIIGKVMLPVALGLSAVLVNLEISNRQLRAEKNQLALSILSSPVEPSKVEHTPLRRWAVSSLSEDFAFSDEEAELLLSGEVTLPTAGPGQSVIDLRNSDNPYTIGFVCALDFPNEDPLECQKRLQDKEFIIVDR